MQTLRLILTLIFVFSLILSFGQETLQEKYDYLLEKTETYEQYKVIPGTSLNSFWAEVKDSLNQNTRVIKDLRSQIAPQQASIKSLEANVIDLQIQLDESLKLNDTIFFMGIPFSKVGYHLMVWLIVVALAVSGIVSYLMFMRSNKVTTRIKREFETLKAEYESHKVNAREKQVKLKRELQTAINQLNEKR